jgi:hypothetical protein
MYIESVYRLYNNNPLSVFEIILCKNKHHSGDRAWLITKFFFFFSKASNYMKTLNSIFRQVTTCRSFWNKNDFRLRINIFVIIFVFLSYVVLHFISLSIPYFILNQKKSILMIVSEVFIIFIAIECILSFCKDIVSVDPKGKRAHR